MLEKRSAELASANRYLHQEMERRQHAESEVLKLQAQIDSLKKQLEEAHKYKDGNGGCAKDHHDDLVSICASCKRIRDERGDWCPVDSYFQRRTNMIFSHGLCSDCSDRLYPGLHDD